MALILSAFAAQLGVASHFCVWVYGLIFRSATRRSDSHGASLGGYTLALMLLAFAARLGVASHFCVWVYD